MLTAVLGGLLIWVLTAICGMVLTLATGDGFWPNVYVWTYQIPIFGLFTTILYLAQYRLRWIGLILLSLVLGLAAAALGNVGLAFLPLTGYGHIAALLVPVLVVDAVTLRLIWSRVVYLRALYYTVANLLPFAVLNVVLGNHFYNAGPDIHIFFRGIVIYFAGALGLTLGEFILLRNDRFKHTMADWLQKRRGPEVLLEENEEEDD